MNCRPIQRLTLTFLLATTLVTPAAAALTQSFPELIDTTEGCAKDREIGVGIVKSIIKSDLRFVASPEDETRLSDFDGRDVSVPRHLLRLEY